MIYKPSDFIYYVMMEEALQDENNILQEEYYLSLENAEDMFQNPDWYLKEGYYEDCFYDIPNEFRGITDECNLSSDKFSRHYDVDFHVQELTGVTPEGETLTRWVGWDYWSGGGKHSAPETIDWISESVFVKVVNEEVVTLVKRTFEREDVNV